MFKDYPHYDATGLAALIAKGEVSAVEVLEAAIARAEALAPRLNAIVQPMYGIARQRLPQLPQGPFRGVPFLLKDLCQQYAGVPDMQGNRALRQAQVPEPAHAEITRRWLDAGVVVFGRTNTPEFGAKGITEPEAWGAAHNPWDVARTPGGSSGGSAAAVAAGIVPMAGANDGGGSIRIPAAYCGLFGLKPGRGRTPWGPSFNASMHGAAINHVLTRSVRDSARMLDATQGPEPGGWFNIAPPAQSYAAALEHEPQALRIGFCSRSPLGTPVDAEAVQAVEDAAKLLESLGHHVELAEPALYGPRIGRDFLTMWFANVAATVAAVQRRTGCRGNDFELDTRAMAAVGRALSATQYVEAYRRWDDYRVALAAFHAKYDFFLTPAVAAAAPHIGEIATPGWQRAVLRAVLAAHATPALVHLGLIERMAEENLKWVPFTQLANLTGAPAMSVPLHWTPAGLPLGVQFIAAPGGEAALLALAAQLERAQPWASRYPELAAIRTL